MDEKNNATNEVEENKIESPPVKLEIKKNDGTPFKVFTPYWRNAEKHYIEKIPPKEKIIKK